MCEDGDRRCRMGSVCDRGDTGKCGTRSRVVPCVYVSAPIMRFCWSRLLARPLPPHLIHAHRMSTDLLANDMNLQVKKVCSDTGNRTPSYRVKGGNVSRYTISDCIRLSKMCMHPRPNCLPIMRNSERFGASVGRAGPIFIVNPIRSDRVTC